MEQPKGFYLVPGTLLDQKKILHEIELVIVTKQELGKSGGEKEAISEMGFARPSPVPDGGPYILQYVFNSRLHEDQVRIKKGRLIAV